MPRSRKLEIPMGRQQQQPQEELSDWIEIRRGNRRVVGKDQTFPRPVDPDDPAGGRKRESSLHDRSMGEGRQLERSGERRKKKRRKKGGGCVKKLMVPDIPADGSGNCRSHSPFHSGPFPFTQESGRKGRRRTRGGSKASL